jgi:DNA (cytosine-5)-methyltransferase 1
MNPQLLVVDLFCGAGGTSTGFATAKAGTAKVIACVNHDPKAIESHWKNHPEVKHFEEDIRTLDLTELTNVVKFQKSLYPEAKLILWASLECTNFSKAKGGQPRDADSRTLADHLHRYVEAINPDYVQIENVVEFMSWGPLDENGKPVSRRNGCDWMRWKREMCAHGYVDEWKEMNSADFGAYTSRNRLFGIFARPDLPICWPAPTHSKKAATGGTMFQNLMPWMPVKHVLDFSDEGESIFTRKKALSDKTLERIYAGLVKFVAKGDTSFLTKYFSGRPAGKVSSTNDPAGTVTTFGGQTLVQPISFISKYFSGQSMNKSVDQPVDAITTIDHHSVVQPISLLKYNSTSQKGVHVPPSIDEPSPVVAAQSRLGIIQGEFLAAHYSNGDNVSSVEKPCPTISTKDRFQFVQPQFLLNFNHSSKTNDINNPSPAITAADKLGIAKPEFFIDKHYNSTQNQSVDQPAGTIMPNDKHRLVEAVPFVMPTSYDNKPKSVDEPSPTIQATRRHHYIVNPSHGGHSTSVDAPCPVIVARQDKAPLYYVQVQEGKVSIAIYDTDSQPAIRIKQFMAAFGLVDIKMRMLRVHELLKIQGFPEGYQLAGNQSDQKKFIGNSVVPLVVKVWAEALADRLNDHSKTKVA